ncbi:hypothetical protein EI555_004683, partial [Monodon monoceros]
SSGFGALEVTAYPVPRSAPLPAQQAPCGRRGQHANCQATSRHWLQDLLHLHDAPHCLRGLPLQCPSLPLFPAAQLPAPGCRTTEDLRSPV